MAIGSLIGRVAATAARAVNGAIREGSSHGSGPLGAAFRSIRNAFENPTTGSFSRALQPGPQGNGPVMKALKGAAENGSK